MDKTDKRAVHATLSFWIHWLAGMSVSSGLLLLFTLDKLGSFPPAYRVLAVVAVLVSIPVYPGLKVFQRSDSLLTGLGRLLAGWMALFACLAGIAFATKTSATYSREVILSWAITGYLAQVLVYLPLRALALRYHRRYWHQYSSLIIGAGELAGTLGRKITTLRDPEPLMGFVTVTADDIANGSATDLPGPILGEVIHLRELISEYDIKRVYIALPASQTDQIEGLYIDLLDANVDIVWVPDLANILLLNHSVHDLAGLAAISLNESPLTANPTDAFFKAALDRAAAFLVSYVSARCCWWLRCSSR